MTKKVWTKTLVPGILALSIAAAMPAGAYAAEIGQRTGAANIKAEAANALKERTQAIREARLLADGLHRETYLLLLAEKYAPATLPEWEAAFAERKAVKEQLQALEPVQNRKEDLQARLEEQKAKLDSGELTPREFKENVLQWKSSRQNAWEQKRDSLQPMKEQAKALKEAFHAAIASGDAAAIQAALGDMLAHYTQVTAQLEKKLEEWTASI
ncbi:hypothetical protein [Paenibacillus sp. PL2-23]|uniref:hypothetical protein n=1 Tax=Paenibacillus sp. PL2-23 TaxID=2100729 RepID=UPI0030F833B6